MTINGWIQIAIYFAVLTALVVPLGRYMAASVPGRAHVPDAGVRPSRARALQDRRGRRDARAALDHLYGRHAAVQRRGLPVRLRAYAPPGAAAAQSSGHVGRGTGPHFQHRCQLCHQHQLAELRRRKHAQLSDADGSASPLRISSRPPPASRSPSPSFAALRAPRQRPWGISGSTLRAAPSTCCCRLSIIAALVPRLAGRAAKSRRLCRRDDA